MDFMTLSGKENKTTAATATRGKRAALKLRSSTYRVHHGRELRILIKSGILTNPQLEEEYPKFARASYVATKEFPPYITSLENLRRLYNNGRLLQVLLSCLPN
jgi:hypothetical protein